MSDNATGWLDPFLDGTGDYHKVEDHWYYMQNLNLHVEVSIYWSAVPKDRRPSVGPEQIHMELVHAPWKGCC